MRTRLESDARTLRQGGVDEVVGRSGVEEGDPADAGETRALSWSGKRALTPVIACREMPGSPFASVPVVASAFVSVSSKPTISMTKSFLHRCPATNFSSQL